MTETIFFLEGESPSLTAIRSQTSGRNKYLYYSQKNDKQIIYNNRPVSLLSMFGKIFENLTFKYIYIFWVPRWIKLNPRTPIWFLNKLFMHKSAIVDCSWLTDFGAGPLEIRVVFFLDMWNVFDKVWHEELIYKLSEMGISGQALALIRSSHRRCSVRKGVLRNYSKFTGKHLYQSLFFNKVAGFSLQLY